MNGRPFRAFGLAVLATTMAATAVPAMAQDSGAETRIRKLEAEVRALQRRVFPGADGRYFEPEISGQPARQNDSSAPPSTTAVTDILARLDALETQIQRLTGQYEEGAYAIRQLTGRVEALEGGTAKPPSGTTTGSGTTPSSSSGGTGTGSTASRNTGSTARPAPTPTPTPAASGPSPSRIAAVRAIAKPQTDDAADDEYSYGFRLWEAGFYPESIQQLTMFVENNPRHWRATYARNLLGRAYLDDGKAREAAPWFLKNYQADKAAARAGDSLLYLAEAMIAIKDTQRACIALSEFAETYPALASGRLQSQYAANRSKVTCN